MLANTASSCAGTAYEFMQRTLLGLEEYIVGKPAMGTMMVQQGRRRPARRHPHCRRARGLGHDALDERAPRIDFAHPSHWLIYAQVQWAEAHCFYGFHGRRDAIGATPTLRLPLLDGVGIWSF